MKVVRSELLKDLLLETKDGEWGKGGPTEGHDKMLVIRGADFEDVRFGCFESVPTRYIPSKKAEKKRLQHFDILIETAGGTVGRPTGRVILIQDRHLKSVNLPVTCASFCRFMRPDQSKVYPPYLYWYLTYLYHSGQMDQYQVQHTGVARFQYTYFAQNIRIPLLSLEVQKKISHVLLTLDKKIELNRRMNETLEQMAMALYKHWFVDFGPFQDGEFMESEIGPIPINWELRSLYSLANYINGMAFKQRDLNDQKEGLPVIKISELNADSPKSAKYYAGPYQDKYFLNTGDVLFSWSATLDIYLWSHGPALLNQHIFNVKSNGSFSKSTLYFILKSVINEFKEIAASRATTMGHIKKEHLEEKLIPYPPAEVRVKIESQFANYFDLMLSNLLEINTLAETRDYLLPRLLSGEIEVREAEEQVEEVLAHA